jgi:prepilin-type processing-associated H-X9-DG protein
VTAGLLLPAVDKVRGAAERLKDENNVKQLSLGLVNASEAYGFFPPQDRGPNPKETGKLSWRVHVLPFIEQDALYKEFHLDEPWDSPHNKTLIAKMPSVFASPLVNDPPGQGLTRYKVFSGPTAVIYPGSKTTRQDITDGTTNTILVVGGGAPVIWTKPEDIAFTGNADPSMLALLGQSGCNVGMCDGSVRWVELKTLTRAKLTAAVTRAGGEPIGLDP